MKFGEMEIENFLAIKSAKLNLSDRGLLLVQGQNDEDTSADSNGAGKSSLMDALSWCLTGTTARGVTGDEIVNNKVGKDTRVLVPIIEDDDTYEVVRHRKHKPHKNALHLFRIDKTGVRHDLTDGTDKLTQEKVNQILGCSYEVFKAAVYAGQEQMPDLPAMTDKSLKMLIEEAAGTEVLERAYKEASVRLQRSQKDHDAVASSLLRARDQLKGATDIKAGLLDDIRKWTDEHAVVVVNAKRDAADKAQKAKLAKEALDKLNESETRDALTAEEAKLKAVESEREEERRRAAELGRAEGAVLAHQAQIKRLSEHLEKESKALLNIDNRVGTPCPSCGKDYCEHDIEDARKLQAEAVDAVTREFISEQQALKRARESRQKLADELSAFRASMTDVSATSAHIAFLNSKLLGIGDARAALRTMIDRVKVAMQAAKDEAAREHPYKDQLERTEKQIAKFGDDIVTLEGDLKKQAAIVETAQVVTKVFSPAGVRAHILDTVTPFLNDQTAKYLGTLSDGNITATWTTLVKNAKGELREKFSIEVAKNGGAASFAGLSGGEKRKVRIACALAMQDMVATRATKPIDLFIGDEIDQALDKAGLERLTAVLEEKAGERGSVVVISHNDLKDWISQVVTVKHSGGSATVEEEIA